MIRRVFLISHLLIIWIALPCTHGLQPHQPFALMTGATGRTGQLVTNLLLDRGFGLRILARNTTKAQAIMNKLQYGSRGKNKPIEICQGDLGDAAAVQAAFSESNHPITHVVFMAGGEEADYNAVNFRRVTECAKQATACGAEHMVVISTAWATRPYSIASLLFNSLYATIPMACHYMGEQELRRVAAKSKLNYVILRAGGLNSDERYAERYPEADEMGLTYQHGDRFEFLGPAGRPGMKRTQLANAVATAVNVSGRYTVEITGSGTVDLDDGTVYETLVQDSNNVSAEPSNEVIMSVHTRAVEQLKQTTVATSLTCILLIFVLGWVQGVVGLLVIDGLLLVIWGRFFATEQI